MSDILIKVKTQKSAKQKVENLLVGEARSPYTDSAEPTCSNHVFLLENLSNIYKY